MAIIKQDYGSLGNDVQTQMLIAPVLPTMISDRAYAVGEQFIVDNVLYKITQAVSAAGVALVVGTNCEVSDSITQQMRNESTSYPDYSNVIKSGFNAGYSYTAPADGWIVGFMNYAATQSASSKINVNGRLVCAVWANNVAMYGPVMCPIKKGDVITTDAQGVYTNLTFLGKRY